MANALSSLNDRQRRFVAEYIVDGNGTQAAIRAGYAAAGAEVQAHRLLRDAKILAAVEEGRSRLQVRTEITQERVLAEIAKLAFSSVRHYTLDDTGNLALREGVPESAWDAVSSVKYKTVTTKQGDVIRFCEFRLWSKPEALQLAAKHLGMLVDKHVVWDLSQLTASQLAEVERRALGGEDFDAIAQQVGAAPAAVN